MPWCFYDVIPCVITFSLVYFILSYILFISFMIFDFLRFQSKLHMTVLVVLVLRIYIDWLIDWLLNRSSLVLKRFWFKKIKAASAHENENIRHVLDYMHDFMPSGKLWFHARLQKHSFLRVSQPLGWKSHHLSCILTNPSEYRHDMH